MNLDVEEKKILYAFGCRTHQSTVCRLKWIASLTVDIKVKHKILYLARKLTNAGEGEWYACFYKQLCMEMKFLLL